MTLSDCRQKRFDNMITSCTVLLESNKQYSSVIVSSDVLFDQSEIKDPGANNDEDEDESGQWKSFVVFLNYFCIKRHIIRHLHNATEGVET